MGNAQSVPVLGEIVTVVEISAKLVAAGACTMAWKIDTARQLVEGAGNSWKEYSERNMFVGRENVAIMEIQGRNREAVRVRNEVFNSFCGFVDNVPVAGHAIGVFYYIAGNQAHCDRCMFNATHSTAVIAAGALTGRLEGGAVLGGVVATCTGFVFDTIATSVTWSTKGSWEAVKQAVDSGDPNKVVDVALGLAGDFAVGSLAAKATKALRERNRPTTIANKFEALLGNPKAATICSMLIVAVLLL